MRNVWESLERDRQRDNFNIKSTTLNIFRTNDKESSTFEARDGLKQKCVELTLILSGD